MSLWRANTYREQDCLQTHTRTLVARFTRLDEELAESIYQTCVATKTESLDGMRQAIQQQLSRGAEMHVVTLARVYWAIRCFGHGEKVRQTSQSILSQREENLGVLIRNAVHYPDDFFDGDRYVNQRDQLYETLRNLGVLGTGRDVTLTMYEPDSSHVSEPGTAVPVHGRFTVSWPVMEKQAPLTGSPPTAPS